MYYKSLIAERTANPTWFYPIGESTTTGYNVTRDGTEDNYVNYWAYPGEVPILDCDTIVSPSASSHFAIRMVGVNWVYFKGLVIRNVWLTTNPAYAWNIGATNCKIENCKVYNVDGNGFRAEGCTNLTFKNCDAYNCYNSGGSYPGSQGTGFRTLGTDVTDSIFFIGCRSYHNSDQGFSLGDEYIRFDSCWSFNNTGQDHGDGHGFKLGWLDYDSDNTRRLVTNCIAAYNTGAGFTTNDNGYSIAGLTFVYNNTAYSNGGGFYVFNTTDTDVDENKRIFRNNIAYDNDYNTFIASGATYTHDHNSWDIPLTLTDADFVSLDTTGITAPRQADGSLPDNDCYNKFLKLSDASQAINRGIDVGLDFEGDAPDLGAFEYGEEEPTTGIKLLKKGIRLLKKGTKFLK